MRGEKKKKLSGKEVNKKMTAYIEGFNRENEESVEANKELRREYYFGEASPLICDENDDYTKPDVFRRRYHRLLEGAGIESKGLHSLRHTFATNLVNGVKQADGSPLCSEK